MRKCVEIDHCHACPHEVFDKDDGDEKYYGLYACGNEHFEEPRIYEELNNDESIGVPEWCPLPGEIKGKLQITCEALDDIVSFLIESIKPWDNGHGMVAVIAQDALKKVKWDIKQKKL